MARKSTSRKSPASRLEGARARMYRELVFESAECVFGRKGFGNATMQEIAAEAGVSLKTVYASFPSKQAIYTEIMRVRGRAMSEAAVEARRLASEPVGMLAAGTRAFVHFLFEHADWMRIHLRSRLSWSVRPEDEVAGALWDQGRRAYLDIIERGIEDGSFCEEDPDEMALMVQALTKVHVSHAVENGETDAEAVADRLITRLLRLICRSDAQIQEAG